MSGGKRKCVLIAVFFASLLGVCACFLLGVGERLKSSNPRESAYETARAAVVQYGRAGSVADKRKAHAVIRSRTQPKGAKKTRRLSIGMSAVSYRLKQVRKGSPEPEIPGDPLTAEERAVLETVNEPICEADVLKAETVANDARQMTDAGLRHKAVESLVSMGEAGLPSLIGFLGDADEKVSACAASAVIEGIREVEDDREVAALSRFALLQTADADLLDQIAVNFVMCSDQRVALHAAIDVIEFGSPAQAAAAKEAYGNVTGEQWSDKKAAETWILENCEAEDDEAQMAAAMATASKMRKSPSKDNKKRKNKQKHESK